MEEDGVPSATVGEHPEFVTGLYRTPEEAGSVYEILTTTHGYGAADVSVVMSQDTRARHFGNEPSRESDGANAVGSFGTGRAIGGSEGAAALGALFAVGCSIAVPGLGLIVSGPIAAALAGAGAGGDTGGVLGALIGAGLPKDRAAACYKGLRDGGIMVGARPRDSGHAAELEREFSRSETDARR
jgi:hypothetical protein